MKKQEQFAQQKTSRDWLILAIRVSLGVVLIFSGLSKILGPVEEFAAAIEKYQALPPNLVMITAKFFPWLEYCLGGFLLLGYQTKISAVSTGVLFSLFLSMFSASTLRGIAINDCGCFGSHGPHFSIKAMMILDSLMLATSVILFLAKKHIFAIDNKLNK